MYDDFTSEVSDGGETTATSGSGALQFPRAARLALDELLDELIARAGDVKATQGRLRGLLAATHHIAAGLELDEVLQRIVESARTLTGARYAALGVVRDGALERFVHSGMTPEEVAAIGDLPAGRGVLGYLIEHPGPLRLDDLSTHPAAAGLPAQHPPMTPFLGAPVRVRGTLYGNLYLTDDAAGRFSADDEELVLALAAAAGLAIENALLYREARRRERWQAVSTQITGELLAGDPVDRSDPPSGWQRLLELAIESAEAHGGAVCAVDPVHPDRVHVLAAVGTLCEWQHQRVQRRGSITDAVLDIDGPVSFEDTNTDPRTTAAAERAPGMRRAVATRLSDDDGAAAMALVLSRQDGAAPFGPLECEMISGFAAHVATALALRTARGQRAAQRRAESSERLARHLNDEVMGQLMRLGLDLAGLVAQVPVDLRGQVLDHIDTVDRLTRTIRDTVFSVDVS